MSFLASKYIQECVHVCVHVLIRCTEEYARVQSYAILEYVCCVIAFVPLTASPDNNQEGRSIGVKQHVILFMMIYSSFRYLWKVM